MVFPFPYNYGYKRSSRIQLYLHLLTNPCAPMNTTNKRQLRVFLSLQITRQNIAKKSPLLETVNIQP